jgi:hypothetical protein
MVKAPRKKAPARSNRGSTLVGVFIGLVLGVLLCAGVMWYINGSSLPLQVREAAPPAAAVGDEPAALPGKPGDKAQVKPRFDFYETLPGQQAPQPRPHPTTLRSSRRPQPSRRQRYRHPSSCRRAPSRRKKKLTTFGRVLR